MVIEPFDAVAVRHYLHRHPELSHQERSTTAYLTEQLLRLGIEPWHSGLGTGVIADIGEADRRPSVALRADIDGLPIHENIEHALRSESDGVMHGCGHDLHMAALLGAAARLQERARELPGRIRLIFQPAEETGNGSHAVIDAGALDGIDAIIGYHNNPNYAPGTVVLGETLMAGCVRFAVHIQAQGTHGGYPEKGTSPIEALATIVLALQTVVSRDISAFEPAVLSITEVHGGEVWNVVPANAGFSGTVRTFSEVAENTIEQKFHSLVRSIAAGYGVEAQITWERLSRPLTNDPHLLATVAGEIPQYARPGVLQPSMAGEDFADYARLIPSVFVFIGSNGAPDAADWHSPRYIGLDETLPTAIDFYVYSALAVLRELATSSHPSTL